jgi:hypothetical protein
MGVGHLSGPPPLDLDAIRDLASEIPDGPWHVGDRVSVDDVDLYRLPILMQADGKDGGPSDIQVAAVEYRTFGFHYPHGDNERLAEFIARSRTLVPQLVDALTNAYAEVARLRAAGGLSASEPGA